MTYSETVQWMFQQLPMFQQVGAAAYKKDLTRTEALMEHLRHPEKAFKSIHIAGTNGKGSTSSLIASVLQESGYKVGLYTSPHLTDFRERIRINGEKISEEYVVNFIAQNQIFLIEHQLSFFEMTVGLAFAYFKTENIDIAVIEVGMGGRLDSTNVIKPLVSVITNIGFDHQAFLGNTLTAIATEKAGIIKPKTPVVIGEYTPETKAVFQQTALLNQAPIYFASDSIDHTPDSDLKGIYQQKNKKTALQALQLLQPYFTITEANLHDGFGHVQTNTGLKGRWQQLQQNPTVICDTAHNSHGLKEVLKQINQHKFKQLHMVLGVVNDKDLDDILPLFPTNAIYYFCKPNIPRGLDASVLQQQAWDNGLKGEHYPSVSKAYQAAYQAAQPDDFIYIGGSTFVVAEVV